MNDTAEPGAVPRSGPRLRVMVSVAVAVVVVVACVVFAVLALRGRWEEARDSVRHANKPLLVAAVVAGTLTMGVFADRWRAAMVLLGGTPTRPAALGWFARGQLGKYAPGGIWHVVGQAELARRGGVVRSVAYPSVIVYTIAILGCCAALSAISLVLPDAAVVPWWAIAGGVAATMIALEPHILRRVLGSRVPSVASLSVGRIARYVASCAPAWIGVTGTTVLVARAVEPDLPVSLVASAALISWLVGIVTIPAPGGVGVREVAFVTALGSRVDTGTATAIALTARFIFVVADLLLVPAAHAVTVVARRRSVAPEPGRA